MKTEAKEKLDLPLALTVIFMAANMRACYTGVGTIVSFIQADLAMNGAVAGMITTIPLIIFAVICPLSAPLSARFGIGKMLFFGMLLNAVGSSLRAFGGAFGLFAGTAILAVGVGVLNALMVGLIKLRFPHHVGTVTSCYTTTMALTSAVGLAINVPITTALGWRWNLALYGILCLAAALIWLPQAMKKENRGKAAAGESGLILKLFKSRRAWFLTVFMGSQSLLFYCITAWMPSILHWRGMSVAEAGNVATVLQLVSLISTLLVPIAAERMNTRAIVLFFDVCYLAGMLLFFFCSLGTVAMWVAVCLIALGLGTGFSACIFLFSRKTSSPAQTAAISGFAQCGGYVLSSVGPVFMGWTYDLSGGWNIAMFFAFGMCVLMTIFSLLSSDKKSVFEN